MDMRQSPSIAIGPAAFQRPIMDNPRHVPHQHDPPSLMHSGAFHISNNMAASSTGPATPLYELPPSMMGQVGGDTIQHPSNTAMDYFDFDLSSFAMEGGLESTGITLDPVPEEIDLDAGQVVSDQDRMMESSSRTIANGIAQPLWSNNNDTQHGRSAEGFVQAAVMTGQQLHEQLAQFHMQSPAIFAQLNAPKQQQSFPSQEYIDNVDKNNRLNKPVSFGHYGMPEDAQKYGSHNAPTAMPTPAQSGEMLPNMHNELVSPMPLGSIDAHNVPGEYSLNERGDIIFTPLLSPAITTQSGSLSTSPQFTAGVDMSHGRSRDTGNDTQRQLEAIQMQQLNLQRQLDQLQQQQHQTQYPPQGQRTPYVSPMINPQMQNNYGGALAFTEGVPAQGLPSHPAQEFFSPLGSPALNPVHHGKPLRARHRSGPSSTTSPVSAQGNFAPPYHPQGNDTTLSPALLPQGGHHVQRFIDANGQAYLTEWAKLLADNASTPTSQNSDASASSPVHRNGDGQLPGDSNQHRNGRTVSTRSPALGPHRSGNGKTRPSPMIKPSHRPGRSNLGNSTSVTSSPLVNATIGSHYSPAILLAGMQSASGTIDGSTGSGSLSPVDLSTILMPPPPVPQRKESVTANFAPITPATLMQLSSVPIPSTQENTVTPRVIQEQTVRRTRRISSSQNGSQNQTPKADQSILPELDVHQSQYRSESGANERRHTGILPADTLDRLRAMKPEAKKTAFRSKASPLLQATKNGKNGTPANEANIPPEVRKSSHKQAEQRRRDSLKAGFDELRLLLPPINAEALDPETGEPIPGSSAPRLLPKSSLVPDSNPNKAVSKVALLKYSNEYIGRLHGKVERRDNYIDILKEAIRSCRNLAGLGPDEQLDELLDYAFEDEDEDEVPTGLALEQEARENQAHSEALDERDDQSQCQPMTKRGRKNTVSSDSAPPITRGKRKSVDPTTTAPVSARSGRPSRRDSIPKPSVLTNDRPIATCYEDTSPTDEQSGGMDADVDMLFDDVNA